MKREPQYLYTGTGERAPRRRSYSPALYVLALVAGVVAGQWWEKHNALDQSGLALAVRENTIAYDRLRSEMASVAGVCSMDIEP